MKKTVVIGMYTDPSKKFGVSDGGKSYGNLLQYPGIALRQKFEPAGYGFFSESELPLEEADIILCVDLTPAIYERLSRLPARICKILQACESVVYAPLSHSGEVLMDPLWDAVMTWNRGFEGSHIVYYDIPIAGKTASGLAETLPAWDGIFHTKGAVMASNKGGDIRGTTWKRNLFYPACAKAGLIDLYGHNWPARPDLNCLGPANDKIEVLKKYSYALVIENIWTSGYVTEKIADCILAGLPVIYMGDSFHAERRFPGAFVTLEEISTEAFLECRNQLQKNYASYHEAVRRSFAASDTWCDSYLAAFGECLKRLEQKSTVPDKGR